MIELRKTYLLGNKTIIASNTQEGIEKLSHMLDSKQYLVRIKSSQSDYFADYCTDYSAGYFAAALLNILLVILLTNVLTKLLTIF